MLSAYTEADTNLHLHSYVCMYLATILCSVYTGTMHHVLYTVTMDEPYSVKCHLYMQTRINKWGGAFISNGLHLYMRWCVHKWRPTYVYKGLNLYMRASINIWGATYINKSLHWYDRGGPFIHEGSIYIWGGAFKNEGLHVYMRAALIIRTSFIRSWPHVQFSPYITWICHVILPTVSCQC